MADDKLNEGSEEEKNENAGQPDEDFGLPDLEFEELEELDFNLDDGPVESEGGAEPEAPMEEAIPDAGEIDMSALEGVDIPEDSGSALQPGDLDPPESALDEGIDEVEDVLDSAQLISDRLGDDEPAGTDFSSDINYDELIGGVDTPESSEESFEMPDFSVGDDATAGGDDLSEDILAGIDSPDDLAALGFADEDDSAMDVADAPAATEEAADTESSLFSADVGDEVDSGSSIFATDSLSMTEEPTSFEAEEKPKLPPNYKPYEYQEKSGGFAKVIIIGVLAISVVGFGLWYLYNKMGEDAKKPVAKQEVKKVVPKKTTPAATKTDDKKEASGTKTENTKPAETKKAEPKAATPKPKPQPTAQSAPAGEIATVESSTGRSYVIISSFIDSDLAMDYARELSVQGKGVKILFPKGNTKRYRVSIADFANYNDAAGQLASFKSEYGDDVWALKY